MTEKWTLKEAQEHYFTNNTEEEREDYGLEDGDGIAAARRHLTMDVSIASGIEDEVEGFSVLLTPSDQDYDEEDGGCLNFSYFIPYRDDITKVEQLEHIAKILGIQPHERVWEDGLNV